MLLSIVMMVKNEEKILTKTLESLEILRQEIDSELIILDTGSEDKTIDIAKQYTEKVYFEKWNDDFSSMRNKSISYAKGQWILILDADEVLVNFEKIIAFFKQGNYNKYNSATIKIKNLHKADKTTYGYCSILRMFKKEGFRYEGIIHEQPLYKQPIYNDIIEVEHYGYLFEDEEFRINKVSRNEKLLLKQLDENPNDPYANYQMGKNLVGEKKHIQAEYYFEKAFELYKKSGSYPEYMYINLAKIYTLLGKYNKSEKICTKYIKKDNKNIDIYYYLAYSQAMQSQFEKSIESFKRYVYLVDNYEISTQANSMFSDGETVQFRDEAIVSIINCLGSLEKYEEILMNYELIKGKSKKSDCYFNLFNSLYKLNKFENIIKYYELIKHSNIEKNKFFNVLENFIKKLRKEEKEYVYNVLCKIDGNYGLLNKIRITNKITLEEARQLLLDEKEIIYGCALNIAFENEINIMDIIYDMDSSWIEKNIYYAITYDSKILISLYNYIKNVANTFDIEKIRIYKIITKIIIQNDSLDNKKYIDLFFIDNMYSYQYLKNIFEDFDDEKIMKFVESDYDRFVVEFRNLIQIQDNEIKLKKIKLLLKEYPYNKKIIDFILKKIKLEISESEELKKLKGDFIKAVENMVENQEYHNAKTMINEYIELYGENSEILNIMAIIKYNENNIEEAEYLLKKSLSQDINNQDIIYNIKAINNL